MILTGESGEMGKVGTSYDLKFSANSDFLLNAVGSGFKLVRWDANRTAVPILKHSRHI